MKINILRYDSGNFTYLAYIVGDASKCGYGKTRKRALGDLIAKHQEIFNIKIVDLTPKLSFDSKAETNDCILY